MDLTKKIEYRIDQDTEYTALGLKSIYPSNAPTISGTSYGINEYAINQVHEENKIPLYKARFGFSGDYQETGQKVIIPSLKGNPLWANAGIQAVRGFVSVPSTDIGGVAKA